MTIVWTEYMRYRASLRGFDLAVIERILRNGAERYHDRSTGRRVAVGRHGDGLVLVPFEQEGEVITPVTVHATTRQQIQFRLNSGRFSHG